MVAQEWMERFKKTLDDKKREFQYDIIYVWIFV